ncbi:hypothetical protein Glove_566g16 [Diversispora epigaea]|uniref:Uncharacterized protein n=1 Tax=Diversispora epigaea TaxID=1348612 RepID=A0A397GA82_9GLOM|nr:hypothetical protein Glove_566g16 [Diversispora epigaea]
MSQGDQTAKDPLDPETVLSTLENILQTNVKNTDLESSAETVLLRSGQDALAALFHSIMLNLGFRLIGLDEDDTFGDNINRDSEGNILGLPENWNLHEPNSYSFRYKHPQSSFTFLVKCIRLANKFLIHGMGIEDNKTTTFELISDNYFSPSAFPYTVGKLHSEPLVNVYISKNLVKDLISLYKINIVQKLIPNLNKPGYEETSSNRTINTPSGYRQPHINDPLRVPQQRSRPPIFDDPYGGDEPLNINPLSVGRDDLDPLGANPIMGIPRFDIPPFGGPNRGGGMFMGPDHPIFDRRGHSRDNNDIYGGPRTLPRGAVPPGARFDPIGPFPSQSPLRGPRGRGRGGSGYIGGEPDGDELPPPGYTDMFM